MILDGTVISGLGAAKNFVKIYQNKIKQITGFLPFAGTLNVKLKSDFIQPENYEAIKSFEQYGKINLIKCTIENINCYIIIPEKSRHDNNIIEIISEYNLRKKLKLTDQDNIKVSTNF